MTTGIWAYDKIANATRNYCSMPSTSQLSDDDLLNQINRYFRWELPSDLRPMQLKTWYQVTLADEDEEYDLKETFYNTYSVLGSLAYISDTSAYKETQIDVYFEPVSFYDMWPDSKDYTDSDEVGEPSGVLVYGNKLLFRKCPDDTYYVNFEVWRRPVVYVSGGTETKVYFKNNKDQPEVPEWGNMIALGTARQILTELGDDESIQRIEFMYKREITRITSQTLLWQSPRRPAPKF